MVYKTFDKVACKRFRGELQAELEQLSKKFGVTFNVGRMRYSGDSVDVAITATVQENVNGNSGRTFEERCAEQHAKILGLVMENDRYKIVAYKTRSYKYPWIMINKSDGKRYKYPRHFVCDVMKEM